MVVKIGKRLHRDHFQAGDQGCFPRIHFRHEDPLESVCTRGGCHRQNAARVTDDPIQGKLTNDECIFNCRLRQKACQNDHTQRNRQVVGGTLFANRSGGKINNHAMTREIQAGILDRRLDALAALLHRGIRQANDDNSGQAVAEIHFHFNNDAFKANDSTGVDAREHRMSVDHLK